MLLNPCFDFTFPPIDAEQKDLQMDKNSKCLSFIVRGWERIVVVALSPE